MDKNNETLMIEINTFLGLVPAIAKMYEEITLAILYLDKAAANVKPPIKSIITEDHIVLRIYTEASGPDIAVPSSSFKTLQVTTNKGTNIAVICNGSASDAQSIADATKTARQRCCSPSLNVLTHINTTKVVMTTRSLIICQVNKLDGISILECPNIVTLKGKFNLVQFKCIKLIDPSSPILLDLVASLSKCKLYDFFSKESKSFQTVLRSQTICSRKWDLKSNLTFSKSCVVVLVDKFPDKKE
mmetsp:Transcript_7887/g.9939  ORF Transcript_7887/g.9939 Transcript_7887/m.9939 type:complete len:244 (-) Transcript_7887:609-1340(-)